MKNQIYKQVQESIFYVTPDLFRGIGLETLLPDYHIICLDDHPIINLLLSQGVKIFSLERATGGQNEIFRNSGKILEHPLVKDYISKNAKGQPNILYFKPSRKLDEVCVVNGYRQLGNKEELNQKFEDKISFFKIGWELGLTFPEGKISVLGQCNYEELKSEYNQFVVQFGRGWAGNTTFFVKNKEDLEVLKGKFGNREVKITRCIKGRTLINNACIKKDKVLVSPPAWQIIGSSDLTKNPGSTCGRQWPANGLSSETSQQVNDYTKRIGGTMRELGYRGFFGLDFLIEDETDKVYISENNARLTASTPFYTKMELQLDNVPLLFNHILEFLGKELLMEDLGRDAGLLGSELVVRNDSTKATKVTGEFVGGIYGFKNNEICRLRDGYNFMDIDVEDEFLVLAAAPGRLISPENELFKLTFRRKILNEAGMIDNEILKIAKDIKRFLLLKK